MNEVQPPPLPYVLHAGGVPVAAVRHRLVTLGPRVLLAAAVPGAILGLVTGQLGAALYPVALVVVALLIVVVVALPILVLYGRSTLTVTDAEFRVRRLRTRRLARAEVGEMVLGYFTNVPLQPGDMQVCLTRRDGSRFTTLPLLYWDRDGLAQVATALGIEARLQDARDERLRPFYVRHLWATAFGGALVGVMLIVGAIVLYDAIAAHQRRDEAAQALRAWRAEVQPRLAALPGVRGIDATTDHTHVDVAYGGGEVAPGTAVRVHDLACAHRSKSLRVDVSYVDRRDPQQEPGRSVRFTCAPASDPGFLLAQLAERPLPRAVRYASFDLQPLEGFDGHVIGTRLEIFVIRSRSPKAQIAATRDVLCALHAPARGQLDLQATVTDRSASSRRADRSCRRTSR